MIYALLFILGAIVMLALRRFLAAILRGVLLIVGVVLGGRLALMADERLAQSGYIGAVIVGTIAALVVIVLGFTFIHNTFVNARRRSAHERVDKEHDGWLR